MRCILNIWFFVFLFAVACSEVLANPPVDPQTGPLAVQAPPSGSAPADPSGAGGRSDGQEQVMTDIHDIRPPVDIGIDPRILRYLLYALGGILILAVIAAFVVYLKRRKRSASPTEIVLPPDQAALEKLRMLRNDDLMDGRLFYFELSSILRGYLEGRFGLDAMEMTTEELIPRITKMELDRDLKQGVRAFIDASDPVKFAGVRPVRENMLKDLQFVEHLVHSTTPREDEDEKKSGPENSKPETQSPKPD